MIQNAIQQQLVVNEKKQLSFETPPMTLKEAWEDLNEKIKAVEVAKQRYVGIKRTCPWIHTPEIKFDEE